MLATFADAVLSCYLSVVVSLPCRRNKALKAFYAQDKVRVIMLSLESAASGERIS